MGVSRFVHVAGSGALVGPLEVFGARSELLGLPHGLGLDLFHPFDLFFFLDLFHFLHSFVLGLGQLLWLEAVPLGSPGVIQHVVGVYIAEVDVFALLLVLILGPAAISSRGPHFAFFVPGAIFLLLLSLILLEQGQNIKILLIKENLLLGEALLHDFGLLPYRL